MISYDICRSLHTPTFSPRRTWLSVTVSRQKPCQCLGFIALTPNLRLLDVWIVVMILAHAAPVVVGQGSPGRGHGVRVFRRGRRGLWIG